MIHVKDGEPCDIHSGMHKFKYLYYQNDPTN